MVQVEKGISPRTSEEALFITFDYDPDYVKKVKTIPGRFWHAHMKAWEVPCSKIQMVREVFGDGDLLIAEDINLDYVIEKGSFEPEIERLILPVSKEFIRGALKEIPTYFKEVPASSSGKYHPSYALGEGGLLRHTKAAVEIAYSLMRSECICKPEVFPEIIKDSIIIALILHDTFKQGDGTQGHTVTEHPLLAADFIIEYNKKVKLFSEEHAKLIADMVRSHMGQWTTDRSGKEVLPKPITKYERFVHLCDYLASRKFLEVPFDEDWNIQG